MSLHQRMHTYMHTRYTSARKLFPSFWRVLTPTGIAKTVGNKIKFRYADPTCAPTIWPVRVYWIGLLGPSLLATIPIIQCIQDAGVQRTWGADRAVGIRARIRKCRRKKALRRGDFGQSRWERGALLGRSGAARCGKPALNGHGLQIAGTRARIRKCGREQALRRGDFGQKDGNAV